MPGSLRARVRDEHGFAMVYVALMLVFLLVVAAIVIDLGNAREQKRQASAAADAGALAGAQAITNGVFPSLCLSSGMNDLNCLAAYDALASSNLSPSSLTRSKSCGYHSVVLGTETCYRYSFDRATVEVTNPYAYGADTSKYGQYVNVRVCWDAQTSFARVIGQNSVNVCGNATAFNSGQGGTGQPPSLVTDCSVEDNFEDTSTNPVTQLVYTFNPGDWPAWGGTVNWTKGAATAKNNEDLVVIFNGNGTELGVDPNTGKYLVNWQAPTLSTGATNPVTANGNNDTLQWISGAGKNGPEDSLAHGIGYVLESIDTQNKVHQYDPGTYPASAGNRTAIAYQLPDSAHLKPGGQQYVFHSTIQAIDSDNDSTDPSIPTHCGEADWTFNADGSFSSVCKEDSFFAYQPDPPAGQIIPAGTGTIKIYYVDESPIENWDSQVWPGNSGFPASPNFGIDFHYSINNGPITHVPQYSASNPVIFPQGSSGPTPTPTNWNYPYWLVTSDSSHTKDKFNTTITWTIPPNLISGTYTIYVKAFDTDHPGGGDCGIVTWSATVKGSSGNVSLVE